ncbi:beta-lactamase family protein [Plantibacter sp. MCCC 1A11337]|uniref:serine hydrolase domain-containing protein n=1 Tax=Plantibacter sp. MCCC 1A11337 TaxID=2736644 RepID=UPI001582A339|nr:serine hydrolase domain-containing protein [Plantibacter sp. MCCC 1A11337]NUJ88331.1 beta-lactamase family protein [Plantibacter sp. MCCC 1A11337]
MNDQTQTHTQTKTQHQTRHRTLIAVSAAAALLAGTVSLSACSSATEQTAGTGSESGPLQDRMQSLVDAGYPAALASVTGPDGRSIEVAAGIGDLATDEPAPVDGEVRIASNTKMFVATVVLQLVEEGTVALDAPIDTYLPGLVTGSGIDGTRITVRQLLQHTAGLPEYADQIAADAFAAQERYISPRDMLDIALAKPAVFAPGERWEYSNTNYLVLGLLIEAVTDRALPQQIDERIVEPLDLEHTYFPAPGERELRGAHPKGYHAKTVGELLDITALDPSFAWSAGAMVSTPHELDVFMQALLDGDLLDEESLAEMQTTVPAGDELWPEASYGLGLQRYPLSCGGAAWGHGGDIPGTQTRNAVGPDGTAVTIAVTSLPWAVVSPDDNERLMEQYRIVVDALDATLCER